MATVEELLRQLGALKNQEPVDGPGLMSLLPQQKPKPQVSDTNEYGMDVSPSPLFPDMPSYLPDDVKVIKPEPGGIFGILGSSLRNVPLNDNSDSIAQPASPKKLPATQPNMSEAEKPPVSEFQGLDFGSNNLANQQGLVDAQKRQNDMQFLANMNRAASQVAGGLAQTGKLDTSIADSVEKQGKQEVDNYKEQVDFQKQDPNSSYSKGLKDYFKNKLGMEIRGDASAVELEKIMPFAVREYEAKLERERKKEDSAKDRELKRELLGEKNDAKKLAADEKASGKEKEQQNSFIERTSKQLEKHTSNLVTLRNAKSAIDAAVQNPSSIKDVGALYSFIKALDPGSVVREGEIALANRASGLFGGLTLKLSQLTSDPKLITAKNLKDIQDSVTQLHDLANSEYDLRRQAAYKRAKSRKITEDRFGEFDPYAGQDEKATKKDPKIQEYADAHFSGDYDKAKALLEKRGYGQK